jgi:hypothetical protein
MTNLQFHTMPYLDLYTDVLSRQTAAHLLRRATMGSTSAEIQSFVGLTTDAAVDSLINNSSPGPYRPPGAPCQPPSYVYTPCANDTTDYVTPYNTAHRWPVDYDSDINNQPNGYVNGFGKMGRPFLEYWVDLSRGFVFWKYVKFWWISKMVDTSIAPSIQEKLSLFWQNHFVTNTETVNEYRGSYKYLKIIRYNVLGNFGSFVKEITKDPAMLRYLNGNENEVGAANENYGRELQELFVVGEKNYLGGSNYTENNIKEAARVLTGWKDNFTNYENDYYFNPSLHDTGNKTFSAHYSGVTITGRSGSTAGQLELDDLVTMLLNHPETPKFICRKLYRWFVHTNVTPEIETNVIIPLANIFKNGNYEIAPVIKKLLKSQHFYEAANIGSLVKSPVDLIVGALRFFNLPAPMVSTTDVLSFHNYADYIYQRTNEMQMAILQQPSVFGYEPYFQTGLTRVWINSTALAQRSSFTDNIVDGDFEINSSYFMKIDLLSMVDEAMGGVSGSPLLVLERFTKDLFAIELNASQKDFLTDTIMMEGLPRNNWTFGEYPAGADSNKQAAVKSRAENLMKYLLRMAEYQLY